MDSAKRLIVDRTHQVLVSGKLVLQKANYVIVRSLFDVRSWRQGMIRVSHLHHRFEARSNFRPFSKCNNDPTLPQQLATSLLFLLSHALSLRLTHSYTFLSCLSLSFYHSLSLSLLFYTAFSFFIEPTSFLLFLSLSFLLASLSLSLSLFLSALFFISPLLSLSH